VITPGEHTIDLRRAADECTLVEKHTRRFGRRCFIAGLATLIAWNVAALVAAIVTENRLWTDQNAQLFGVLGYVLGCCTGAILTLVGAWERILRPVRERQAYLAGEQGRLNATLQRVSHDSEQRVEMVMGTIGALPHRMLELTENYARAVDRLDLIEKAVQEIPDYSRGVKDGLQLRRGYIDPDSVDPT
jgi:hypothetical protein